MHNKKQQKRSVRDLQNNNATIREELTSLTRISPMPDTQELQFIEEKYPGATQLFVNNIFEEAQHRRKMDELSVEFYNSQYNGNYKITTRGQILALLAIILVIGFCVFLALTGNAAEVKYIFVSVVGLAATFAVIKAFPNKKDKEEQS